MTYSHNSDDRTKLNDSYGTNLNHTGARTNLKALSKRLSSWNYRKKPSKCKSLLYYALLLAMASIASAKQSMTCNGRVSSNSAPILIQADSDGDMTLRLHLPSEDDEDRFYVSTLSHG